MKAHGNGNPEQCVENLLRITRGENPLERLKGLDSKLIDKPSSIVEPSILSDAEDLVEGYEPRTNIEQLDMVAELAQVGRFILAIQTDGERREIFEQQKRD